MLRVNQDHAWGQLTLGRAMSWGKKFSTSVVKAATENRNSSGWYSCSHMQGYDTLISQGQSSKQFHCRWYKMQVQAARSLNCSVCIASISAVY